MHILVDADACPVKEIIEKVAKEHKIPVTMIIDESHVLSSEYSEIITVSQGKDSVDLYLINKTNSGDIVVTQDYGVASLALAKKAYAIGNSGLIYTDENIDKLMFERFLGQKVRRAGKKGGKTFHPKKRTDDDNEHFEKNFSYLVKKAIGN